MVLLVLALIIAIVGVVGAIVPIIPGALLSFVALLLSYFSSQPAVSTSELFVWLAISVVVSIVDNFLPVYLTKRLGGSKSGVWGATIGMIVGFIAFPPLGVIFCPLLGAIMGELLNDKEDLNRAIKVGLASLLAFVVGTGLKFALSIYILSLIISSQMELISEFIESLKGLF